MKEWTAERTASTYVEDSTDVQAAWNSLTTNFEGEDAISTIVLRVRNAIRDSHFTQNTNNFTFQDYCTKHIKSNNELDRYNANVDGASQVTAFLRGIRADERNNAALLPIKAIITTSPDTSEDVRKAVEKFKDVMIRTGLSVDKPSKQTRRAGAQHHQGGRGGHGGR